MPRLVIVTTAFVLASLIFLHQPQPRIEVDLDAAYTEREVIVRLHPVFAVLSNETLASRLEGQVIGRLPELDSVRLRLQGDETPVEAIERLMQLPDVAMAEPNHRLRAAVVPSDPYYSAQSAYLALIEAPAAWDIELGDDSVIVAVLDSGLDLGHPDLQGRFWLNPSETPSNGIDDDNNGCVDDINGCSFVSAEGIDSSCELPERGKVTDDNGHGTFVSGIIAAQANNGLGVSGVAPGVTVAPVKILDCKGGGTAVEAAQGILYAARIGARVANISFGADGESVTLANAIREAYERYGMVIIAATGNEGTNRVTFPARLPQTIAVASSGIPEDPAARSPFSDWGPEVAFAAPGLNIISTLPSQFCDDGWQCVAGDTYAVASGTSFAAPIASGAAALLISRTPFLTPAQVREILRSTAEPLPDALTPNWDGAGRLMLRDALLQPRYYIGAAGVAKQ